jgi:uncharacterized DUF497 family protein
MYYFQWDIKKAAINERKHQVSFSEGATVFFDSSALLAVDLKHSEGESRFLAIGLSDQNRVLLVSFTHRRSIRYEKEIYRIISVRSANKKERKVYFSQS